jgi:hypothetical protein
MMSEDLNRAEGVVRAALAELNEIAVRVRMTGNVRQMMAELDRWKQRTIADIRTHISAKDSAEFARVGVRPSWIQMEGPDDSFERNEAFLVALLRDLELRPGRTIATPASAIPKELAGKPFIFLSHAAADAALAELIEQTLRASVDGFEVFRTTRVAKSPRGDPGFSTSRPTYTVRANTSSC